MNTSSLNPQILWFLVEFKILMRYENTSYLRKKDVTQAVIQRD